MRYLIEPEIAPDRANPISEELFGATYTGFFHFRGFESQAEALGVTHVRWPGGTLSEMREDIYDLTRPTIFDGTQLFNPNPGRVRPDLPDMLDDAKQNGTDFSIILPTVRYADDIEAGVQDLEQFLGRLYGGEFGPLPADLTLEIGNEYYASDELSGAPDLYGEMANRFIETIERVEADETVNTLGARVEIALQMGINQGDDEAIRGEIGGNSLAAIDALVFHHLPIGFNNLIAATESEHPADAGETRFERIEDYFDAWSREIAAIGGDVRSLELFMSAWTVGQAANDPSDVLLEFQDYGLQAASTALHLIASYAEIGVDSATVWGIDVPNLNRLSTIEGGQTVYRPLGLMFEMMAETLPGATALGWSLDYTRSDAFMVYGFETDESVIVYVAANDISDAGASLTLDFSMLAQIGAVDGRRLTSDLPADAAHLEGEAEAELYEFGLIQSLDPQLSGRELTLDFHKDYEVIEITIDVPEGARWIIGESVVDRGAELLDMWIDTARSEQLTQEEVEVLLDLARAWETGEMTACDQGASGSSAGPSIEDFPLTLTDCFDFV